MSKARPALRNDLYAHDLSAWADAKARAVLESALFSESFPEACPFTDAEILADGFYPDPYGDDPIRGDAWRKRTP